MAASGRGAFGEATVALRQAERAYAASGDTAQRVRALTALAAAYRGSGLDALAVDALVRAHEIAEGTADPALMAGCKNHLGAAFTFVRRLPEADEHLTAAAAIAAELTDPSLRASILNNLGNLRSAQLRYEEAADQYRQAIAFAEKAGETLLAAQAAANAAFSALQGGQLAEARRLNGAALDRALALADTRDKAFLLVTIGQTDHQVLAGESEGASSDLVTRIRRAYTEGARIADAVGDARTGSYAYGHLGRLYEQHGTQPDALRLTRRAVFLAQQAQAPESLYRWQWQNARLLRNDADPQHDPGPALAAYERATATLQSIRHDVAIAHANRNAQSTFREQVGPLFFEQADLQLRQAARAADEPRRRAYLIAARETVESLKSAELADYFQDECVDILKAKERPIDEVGKGTAVAYLIPLPDRLELLVTLPEGLKQFRAPVGSARVEAEVRAFRTTLEDRTTYDFLPHAQQLHKWIIEPMREELDRQQINTLVFVPDGALRTTPMAALHDGERFLIESYAVAITPGLKLMEPRPIRRENVQLLSSGLSEAREGFAPLPHVPQELSDLSKVFGGVTLLNRDFRERNLQRQMSGQSYSIVHVASHGRFSSNARETFLLTYDDKLDLNELERLIQPSQFRGQPVELLMLSACQTAAGDDRAALGLAGIAIKAGARSAAATLWFVNDEASSQLVTNFYQALNDPDISKAQAMRRAQMQLLADRRYEHPCYWAPFLIIGNWL